MLRFVFVAWALIWGTSASAQIDTNGMQGVVDACFEGSNPWEGMPDCVGLANSMCQEVNGYTTVDAMECISHEAQLWDDYLNTVYQMQRAELQRRDAETGGPISRAEGLLEAQRAWIAFRDAECGVQYAMHQNGTLRAIIGATCRQDLTAQRVFELLRLTQG